MGLAANGENRGFDSYINKPMRAMGGAITGNAEMEKLHEGKSGSRQASYDAQKLPKLNRHNVRSLDESSQGGMVTPDRRSGMNKSVSQASFHRGGLVSKSV